MGTTRSCLSEEYYQQLLLAGFLKAIDHMEFHPTLGKEKKGTSYRLHR